jgi:hypothetical protein
MSRFAIALLVLMLAACGAEPPPPPEPAPRQPTVFDDQLQAMEKAKAVEQVDEERLKKMDEQIDAGQ